LRCRVAGGRRRAAAHRFAVDRGPHPGAGPPVGPRNLAGPRAAAGRVVQVRNVAGARPRAGRATRGLWHGFARAGVRAAAGRLRHVGPGRGMSSAPVPVAEFAGRVRRRLVETGGAPTAARVAATVQAEPGGGVLGRATLSRLVGRITDELAGAGPLAPLLADEQVSDVLVNGGSVWVDRGHGLQRVAVDLGGPDEVRRLAQRLAAAAGRRLDDGCPCADVPLPDGTRLHAVLPPVAVAGPYLSLRAFRRRAFSLDELVAAGGVPPAGARLLAAIVAAR